MNDVLHMGWPFACVLIAVVLAGAWICVASS